MDTYKIVRHFFSGRKRVIKRGLTLEEAQKHCADPNTSSTTCTDPKKKRITKIYGSWFDGYNKE